MNQVLTAPKPLNCVIERRTKRTVFNSEELRAFLEQTNATTFIVEDADGNQSVILAESILELLAELEGRSRL
jgi:hypothetical protein